MRSMQQQILAFLQQEEGYITFNELIEAIPHAAGDIDLLNAELNIVLWKGVSDAFLSAFNHLMDEKLIELKGCDASLYHLYGSWLDLPIATERKMYTAPHWLPVLILPVKRLS